MQDFPVVAFMGKRGSGKDTAAAPLIDSYYLSIAFADPVRALVKTAFGVSEHELSDRVLKEQPLARWPHKSPRVLMQAVATQMKAIDPDVFVKWVAREIAQVRAAGYAKGVVITDLRHTNEADYIRSMGGLILQIIDPAKAVGTSEVDQHASETEQDSIVPDETILNNQTIQDLHDRVRAVLLREKILEF